MTVVIGLGQGERGSAIKYEFFLFNASQTVDGRMDGWMDGRRDGRTDGGATG